MWGVKSILIVPVAMVIGLSASAQAQTTSFAAVADATLFAESGDLASGADDGIFAGVTGNTTGFAERRALIRFDLSTLPAGAVVQAVTLRLFVTRSNSGSVPIELHKLTSSWGEGTSTAGSGGGAGGTATSGSATWTWRTYLATGWTNLGGDFVAAPRAVTAVTGAGAAYDWSSSAMVADVQSWLANPASNFGWLLLDPNAVQGGAKRFASREFATATQRPVLIVTYDVGGANGDAPLPTTAWFVLGLLLLGTVLYIPLRAKNQ